MAETGFNDGQGDNRTMKSVPLFRSKGAATILMMLLLAGCSQGEAYFRPAVQQLPDFAAYKDVKEKKKAFFDLMRPIIEDENRKVTAQRERMMSIRGKLDRGDTLSESEQAWLMLLASEYNVEMNAIDDQQAWMLLGRRVDRVPFRLALAQAANESNWGTSRFAREGMNLFGQWCFTPGCGIVPAKRPAGMRHEVAIYTSVNESVAAYIRSINRVYMYMPLRVLRHSIRKGGNRPTAVELARELSGYSERGEAYVKEIQAMIRTNYDLMSGEFTVTQQGS
ncbi:MAG: glucosaminidase domain-containing protein [Mariprofundaceae bacterium]|nr:glucosaminidase domain-containing protein [Mariprofundaceae bacterium]